MSGRPPRALLAESPKCTVEIEGDHLHVHAGALSLRLDRATCEELTTTLAIAMVRLARATPRPALTLVHPEEEPCAGR